MGHKILVVFLLIFIFKDYIPKTTNPNILYKAAYEAKHIGSVVNIYEDIQRAKDIQHQISFSTGNLKGHVQQVTQSPWAYVLVSDIQVFIQKINLINTLSVLKIS